MSITSKIQSLINKANETTLSEDTDLTTAMKSLIDGYTSTSNAPIRINNQRLSGLVTLEQPFSEENINRDWDLIINATPDSTSVESYACLGILSSIQSGSKRWIEVYYSSDRFNIYSRGGYIEAIGTVYNKNFVGRDLVIQKRNNYIYFIDDGEVFQTLEIYNPTTPDTTFLTAGYWHGDAGHYYFRGTFNKFEFKYIT